ELDPRVRSVSRRREGQSIASCCRQILPWAVARPPTVPSDCPRRCWFAAGQKPGWALRSSPSLLLTTPDNAPCRPLLTLTVVFSRAPLPLFLLTRELLPATATPSCIF